MRKITANDIETVLVRSLFDFRRWLVVANVSWGLRLHECDLLALSGSGYANEIEIKVSVADLKRDKKKRHSHNSNKIKFLWFAGPESIENELLEHAPARAGVLCVYENKNGYRHVRTVRKAVRNKAACAWSNDDRYQLARLGTMRYWSRRKRAG